MGVYPKELKKRSQRDIFTLMFIAAVFTVAEFTVSQKSILKGMDKCYTDSGILLSLKKELKSLLMKVKKESEKAGLKFNIQKTNIMAPGPITSWQTDGETMETVTDYFLGSQNHCRLWLQPWN